jgi:hypothetical protein
MSSSRALPLLDRVAIALSSACAVHCLLTPLALALLPALGGTMLADESFHFALLVFILPSSLIALILGCWRHKDRAVIALGAAGLGILVLAALSGPEWLGNAGERGMTLLGSFAIMAGHMRNFRLCRRDDCTHSAFLRRATCKRNG